MAFVTATCSVITAFHFRLPSGSHALAMKNETSSPKAKLHQPEKTGAGPLRLLQCDDRRSYQFLAHACHVRCWCMLGRQNSEERCLRGSVLCRPVYWALLEDVGREFHAAKYSRRIAHHLA